MRIIVKNLPSNCEKSEIEVFFTKNSKPTDIFMVTDPRGIFRRICFIGYESISEANKAVEYFDKNMFKNHKIRVEIAKENENELKKSSDAVLRKIQYSKTVCIKNINKKIDSKVLEKEFSKFGKIENFKLEANNDTFKAIVKFHNGSDAIEIFNKLKILLGMRVKVELHNEVIKNSKKQHYNALFFDFDTVIKKTCESERINRTDLINIKDKDLGSRVAALEANLVEQTKIFLENNDIFLDSIEGDKNKTLLIIKNPDILGVLDLVKGDCKIDVAPSGCLALLKFNDEKEALQCYKDLNYRRYKNQMISCEFAPLCKKPENSELKKEKPIHKTNKIIIKNVPFQASKKELKDIFSSYLHVVDVRLPVKQDGSIRGFGFIVLDSPDNVDKALEHFGTNTHLYGRRLVLEKAKQ